MMSPTSRVWRKAWRASLPALFGYVPLGVAFGLLFARSGVAAWYWAPIMSLAVYAGAAQFIAVSLLAAGASAGELALSTLVVNLRHAFYGTPLVGKLPKSKWAAMYVLFGLTDETYGILTTDPTLQEPRIAAVITALTHTYWVVGTLVGALAAQSLHVDLQFLEFCLVGLFAVLAVEQVMQLRQWPPVLMAAGVTCLAHVLCPNVELLASIAASAALLAAWDRHQHREVAL